MRVKKKYLAFLFILSFSSSIHNGYSQEGKELSLRGVYSPQTHDLGNHTFTPVSFFAGQPSINIPVYTVKHHDLEIPISLSYDASGFIPNKAPSVVGLNWSLIAGGMISRTVNHIPDEMIDPDGTGYALGGFFRSPRSVIYSNSTVEYLGDGILGDTKHYEHPYELSPDLFVFNFAGHSGKFMMGHDGKFKMQSDGAYKIDITYLDPVVEHYALSSYTGKIIITDANGIIYEFGGSLASVEYSYMQLSSGGGATYVPNAWYLTKVTTPEGYEMKFIYANDVNLGEPKLKGIDSHFTAIPLKDGIMVVKNVYLRAIESRSSAGAITQTVNFYNSLRSKSFSFYKNEKLDSLVVKDAAGISRKKFKFTYDDHASRMFLNSFEETGLSPYEFGYLAKYDVEPGTQNTDYWGFFNNKTKTIPTPPVTYNEYLDMITSLPEYESDVTYSKANLLVSIKNPLGGMTEYSYEGHTYGGFYGLHDLIGWRLYDNNLGNAGGVRLAQVSISDGNGKTQTRQYKYVRNYSPSATGLISSGILSRKPNYFKGAMLPVPELLSIGEPHITYSEVAELFSDSGYTVHKFTAIEYPDRTYDYDDINKPYYMWIIRGEGMPIYDEYSIINFYKKRSSTALERGRPSLVTHFNNAGKRVSSTAYTYNTNPNRYEDRIAAVDFPRIGYTVPILNAQINSLITTSNTYFFDTQLTKSEESWYDATGTSVNQLTITRYEYNQNRQVKLKTMVNSNGDEEIEKYRYVGDYVFTGNTHPLKSMQDLHILSPIVEQQHLQKTGVTTALLQGELIGYSKWSNIFKPQYIRRLVFKSPSTDTTFSTIVADTVKAHAAYYAQRPEIVFDSYTVEGKIQQFRQKGLLPAVTYIWNYAGQYPIAEVKNAVQADVAYAGFEADGKGNWSYSGSPLTDATSPTGKRRYALSSGQMSKASLSAGRKYILEYWIKGSTHPVIVGGAVTDPVWLKTRNGWSHYRRVFWNTTSIALSGSGIVDDVRLYPIDAQMMTYTYDPLVGMSSETDAAGRTIYYEYDGALRLKSIKDQDGNILKNHIYHYKP